jgi:amidase
MADAIVALKRQGAIVVDPANIPSVVASAPDDNFLLWPFCTGAEPNGDTKGCSLTFAYGMKRDFNAWLTSLGAASGVKTLTELRAWNTAHERAGAIKYGQARLDISDSVNLEADRARYERDRAKDVRLAATQGIDAILTSERLDALLFPAQSGAEIAARAGYPSVIVPFGTVPNGDSASFPPGFDPKPAPYGVSFTGTACSEPRLIALAYAFEQATKRRVPPGLQ